MPVLYVTQPGAEVRKKGARVQVTWQGQTLAALPVRAVERLVLLGPAQISAAAAHQLLKAGIPVLYCSQRGDCYGTLSNGADNAELVLRQVERYRDGSARLATARALVEAKTRHQQRLLRRHARNHPHPALSDVADELERLVSSLTARTSVAEVMGVEGAASARYFSVFGRCLRPPGVSFRERNRRPPRDPVNAVLSLGYMLVLGEVIGAVVMQGLHPGMGSLHEISPRRPALALDLLELARQPIVDRLTLSLFNRKVLTADDFHTKPSGEVRMTQDCLERYLQLYDRTMTATFQYGKDGQVGSFRDWLRGQAEALKKALMDNRLWQPALLEL